MRNVALFIAMSLDGYIAKKDGSVDWLQGQETDKMIWCPIKNSYRILIP